MGSYSNDLPPLGDPVYWHATSGEDLKLMLQLVGTSKLAQRGFLDFYRDIICPALGGKPAAIPNTTQKGSVLGWDGNPFEYSFEFKGSTKTAGVRFAADFTQHRPVGLQNPLEPPLGMSHARRIIDHLSKRTPGFDDTWDKVFYRFFSCENLDTKQQNALATKIGFQTPMMLGFDIKPGMMSDSDTDSDVNTTVPVMLKSYYVPHYTVIAKQYATNWDAIQASVRLLPDINETSPNLLKALRVLETYLVSKPASYRKTAQYMATDFIDPRKARLKIYFRFYNPDPNSEDYNFDDIWDYYTLGGRIPDLEDDKPMLRNLVNLITGHGETSSETSSETLRRHHQPREATDAGREQPVDYQRLAKTRRKPVAFYFSLTPDKPYPTSKVYYNPAHSSKLPNDLTIARGIDQWMDMYGWNDGGMSVEERVQTVFSHRRLEEKNGIFTFIAFGRKEDDGKKSARAKGGISLSVYVTPELYENPRF